MATVGVKGLKASQILRYKAGCTSALATYSTPQQQQLRLFSNWTINDQKKTVYNTLETFPS